MYTKQLLRPLLYSKTNLAWFLSEPAGFNEGLFRHNRRLQVGLVGSGSLTLGSSAFDPDGEVVDSLQRLGFGYVVSLQ
jgi:hypothetical protein